MDCPILEIRERISLRLPPPPPPVPDSSPNPAAIWSSIDWVRSRTLPLRGLVSGVGGGGVSTLKHEGKRLMVHVRDGGGDYPSCSLAFSDKRHEIISQSRWQAHGVYCVYSNRMQTNKIITFTQCSGKGCHSLHHEKSPNATFLALIRSCVLLA